MDPIKEKTVGCTLAAGFVIAVVSGILMWVFALGGGLRGTYTREPITNRITDAGTMNLLPLMLVFMVIGILMVGGSIGYGLWLNKNQHVGPRMNVPHAKVLARYGVDSNGYTLSQDYEIEHADNPRYYIRLQIAGQIASEYETSPEVFYQCGEGMTGEVELQGRWIGKFTPYIGVAPTS